MVNETEGYSPIRRVVTGHDANGTAKVLIDGPPTNRRTSKSGGVSTLIWCTDCTPADIAVGENAEDMGARVLGTPPSEPRYVRAGRTSAIVSPSC